ncbi:hypothetical protein B4U37_20065 [Sutcliffiella horikoshii]|uniref:Polysaccharide pyruvyl transferase domain-containing protein n=1 Tax=Sutcliffiella horikoshii TaxID=79883 RepID=A0ABM6KNT4_9BACI|nr:polysaccharide pyruvyl transferase family protein [Sutcliffiella horikoshii]ART78197.1 hypothetical protein B4U37_20065 [Sutcliffiella horikoshii]
MKEIAIVGAFDRYNYGDLLFPIIIENYIKKYRPELLQEYSLGYYGLISSDLSSVGGKKTDEIRNLIKRFKNSSDENVILISGGEVLPARWYQMYEHLSRNSLIHYIKKVIRKTIGKEILEAYVRRRLGVEGKFPWIFIKEDVGINSKIFYNTVGGSNISNFSSIELAYVKSNLRKIDYFSVRDNLTMSNFEDISPIMAPDSAIIMSTFFTEEVLKELINPKVKEYVEENSFICFQTNLTSSVGKEKIIASQLKRISQKSNLRILLLPIGFASGHDNQIALQKILTYINPFADLMVDLNIYDIMYLIAKSQFFAGTSLHGNITASSYAVPHIGLGKKIYKLDSFTKTWDIEDYEGNVEFEELYDTFIKYSKIPKMELETKRDYLITKSLQNFNQMFDKI